MQEYSLAKTKKTKKKFQINLILKVFQDIKSNSVLITLLDFEMVESIEEQEGHDGPVSLHWLICEIHSYQTLHYLGIGLKHKTPYKD